MWVKLTSADDGETIYINLNRFDQMASSTDENDVQVTVISVTLSDSEGDLYTVSVKETPEQIMTDMFSVALSC